MHAQNDFETNDSIEETDRVGREKSLANLLVGIPFGLVVVCLVWLLFCPWIFPQWLILVLLAMQAIVFAFDLRNVLRSRSLPDG